MASAWGGSWGSAWGNSWGSISGARGGIARRILEINKAKEGWLKRKIKKELRALDVKASASIVEEVLLEVRAVLSYEELEAELLILKVIRKIIQAMLDEQEDEMLVLVMLH